MNIFRKNKNKTFWDWFMAHSNEFIHFEKNQDKLFNQLSFRLSRVNKYACFEFGPLIKGKRKFVISCDGVLAGSNAVQNLVTYAPQMKQWEVIAFRQRQEVSHILFDGKKFSTKDIYFRYRFNEHNKIDLFVYIKGYKEIERAKTLEPFFVILDAITGEYDGMTKIGRITYFKLNEAEKTDIEPITNLRTLLDTRTY